MKYLKTLVLTTVASALVGLAVASAASATVLNGSEGMLTPGTSSTAVAEGTITIHPPIGDIECKKSTATGTTTNTGSSTETIVGKLEGLTYEECNATVKVVALGTQEIHTTESKSNNNGTLTATGTEVTIEFIGFHCIFKTNGTDLGVVTGSATTGSNATIDLVAAIPRTGGRSGAFCGSTAQLTGSYKITSPSTMNVE